MQQPLEASIREICAACGNDRSRMMDVVQAVQGQERQVSGEAMELIARELGTHRVEVQGVVSFYAFLSSRPTGKVVIRLCNDVTDKMQGFDEVAGVFREELGIDFGETTPDGRITLEQTASIGMCDQAPAALVNDVVVPELSTDRARRIIKRLRGDGDPRSQITKFGDGNNAHKLVRALVKNNIRKRGPVVFAALQPGAAIQKTLAMSPAEVIRNVKTSRLRGRGGAGFPTGMKWEFTRAAAGDHKTVICNADEGEPGTFKDRVILTECPDLFMEGMTIAAYALGADTGILYLRGEYAYLRAFLESVLARRRDAGLLGKSILERDGFDFDIRIQLGSGAYICGEETALISSSEGLRGDPKNRPPFPAQHGYLGTPTSVNNVETFCCVARIIEKGPAWFSELGSAGSTGTKLLSVSGDCHLPGVYEVEFGIRLREVLEMVGAEDTTAVQVGGPSGQLVGPDQFGEEICFDKLATGGSVIVFGPGRDPLWIASEFLSFFVEESCGYCTPCRVGNVLLKERVDRIRAGRGEAADLDYLRDLCDVVKQASRCGLGQTSPNPVTSTLENFNSAYTALLKENPERMELGFDLAASVRGAEELAGRKSVHSGN